MSAAASRPQPRQEAWPDRAFRRLPARLLDRTERVLILALWVWLLQRVLHSVSANPDSWLLLVSETSVMLFTLIRRPTDAISMRLGDWLLAIAATAAPLMIQPGHDAWPALRPLGMSLWMCGNIIQAAAKLSLRRSFGVAPANRGIKSDGLYRFVRHPMYAGYLLVHVGQLILFPGLVNALIYSIGWYAQILRLLAEEALLGQDPAYRTFVTQVRYRLIPGIF